MITIPVVSRDYLFVPNVRAFDPASPDGATDVTTLTVEFAFMQHGDPGDDDWHTGEWDTEIDPNSIATARILIGPSGTVTLTRGVYEVWLRVTGGVEKPAHGVGRIKVT